MIHMAISTLPSGLAASAYSSLPLAYSISAYSPFILHFYPQVAMEMPLCRSASNQHYRAIPITPQLPEYLFLPNSLSSTEKCMKPIEHSLPVIPTARIGIHGLSSSGQFTNGKQGNIYLLGNPAIWWGSLAAMISGLIVYFARRSKRSSNQTKTVLLLIVAYLINYLPFAAVTRVMFLYHYFFSLIFEIMLAVILWDFISKQSDDEKRTSYIYFAIIGIISLSFIYFSPLTYGFPMTPKGLMQHIWIHTWR
jgi:hypothetical protein